MSQSVCDGFQFRTRTSPGARSGTIRKIATPNLGAGWTNIVSSDGDIVFHNYNSRVLRIGRLSSAGAFTQTYRTPLAESYT
jgi:hypothetical protein